MVQRQSPPAALSTKWQAGGTLFRAGPTSKVLGPCETPPLHGLVRPHFLVTLTTPQTNCPAQRSTSESHPARPIMAEAFTKKPTGRPTTFFDFPFEVRLLVYKFVLTEAVSVLFDSWGHTETHNFHRTLRLTCRAVNEDLWSRLRPHITAIFVGFEELQERMQTMSTSSRDQISRVIVLRHTRTLLEGY